MNIYDISAIEKEIESIAIENDGEIPEEKLQELVEAQTQSLLQIEKLCKYVRHLEQFADTAKAEEERIRNLRTSANSRMESIKKYLIPYVKAHRKVSAGTFTLSTRKSESIELSPDFNDPLYTIEKVEYKPDKKAIKEALKKDAVIIGATLKTKDNLQIK